MTSTNEELGSRLDRLERDVRSLSSAVSRSMGAAGRRGGDAMTTRISFVAWLQITAPTFVTMVFGFTLLWNAQQAMSAQIGEMSRTLGRLEGTIAGVDARLGQLDERLDKLDGRLDSLDSKIGRLGDAVDKLAERLGSPS